MPSLITYINTLRKTSVSFDCPHCDETVSSEHFEDHCFTKHELNTALRCVWCFGHTAWPKDSKSDYVGHLIHCYRSFLKSYAPKTPPPTSPDKPTLLDVTPLCEGETHSLSDLPDENSWAMRPVLTGLTYQSPALNLAVACLQLYLNGGATMEWNHVALCPPAFESFQVAMNNGRTRMLPFSCFCDGGGEAHRHFLLTSPRGEFSKVFWKSIRCTNKPFNARRSPIASPMQLIDLMAALSQPRTRCEFESAKTAPGEGDRVVNYHVSVPLPRLCELVLAAQWDGGVLELVRRDHASVQPHLLVPGAQLFGGLWGVRVKDLPRTLTHVVLPVSAEWIPCAHATESYVHLTNGRKLYFEWTEDAVVSEGWVKMQAEKGNSFYDAIGNEIYYPSPYQQKCLTMIKPQEERILELEWTVEGLEMNRSHAESSVQRLKNVNRSLKRKLNESEKELKVLYLKHISYLEKDNDFLRMKNHRSKVSKLNRFTI